jgi:hypothetical protein
MIPSAAILRRHLSVTAVAASALPNGMTWELSEHERRNRRRAGCAWGCGGALVLSVLLAGGIAAYWSYANQLPTLPPPLVTLPSPNARDECLAAVALLPPNLRNFFVDFQEGKETGLKEFVTASQPALSKVRASFKHVYLTPPVTSYSAAFPELAQYRDLARLFAAEGRLAEQEGRLDDAVRSYLDCYRFGGEIQRGGPLIHGLVGIAVEAIALAPLDELSSRLDEHTAASTARELALLQAKAPTAADALASEARYGEISTLEMMKQAGGSYQSILQTANGGAQPMDWDSLQFGVRYAFTPKKEILANYRRMMAQYVAKARKPYGQRGPDPPRPTDPINQLLLPAFSQSMFAWDRSFANARLIEGKLAARAYSLRHGRMPARMEDVSPEIVPSVPIDWYGGKPLRIGPLEGNGPSVVYSLGPDMDDDKGRALGQQVQQNSDGDLVEVHRRKRLTPKPGGAIAPTTTAR